MVLKIENVSYSYGQIKALDGVSFEGNAGEIVGVIGSNGAGKTTLIKTIIQYLSPGSGNIYFNGTNINSFTNDTFPISYIPDAPVFYEELSVEEHLHFVKTLYPDNEINPIDLMKQLELSEHKIKIPSALSKGTKQKLSIALALLRSYNILLADEPFTGLDPKQISELKDIFIQNKQNHKLVLLSTHLLDLAEGLCDKYILIHKGIILAKGTKENLAITASLPNYSSLEGIYLKLVSDYA